MINTWALFFPFCKIALKGGGGGAHLHLPLSISVFSILLLKIRNCKWKYLQLNKFHLRFLEVLACLSRVLALLTISAPAPAWPSR